MSYSWLDELIGPYAIQNNGVTVPRRPALNFIGTTFEITDNYDENKTDLTFTASAPTVDRYTPIDEHTLIQWKLDEALGPPFANTGTAGTLNLILRDTAGTNGKTTPPRSSSGPFGLCRKFYDTTLCTETPTCTVEPTGNSFSVHAWAYSTSYSTYNILVSKAYAYKGNSWVPPFAAIHNTNCMRTATITVSGTLYEYNISAVHYPTDGAWHHCAMTYDGATLNYYIDGDIVSTNARAGTIDYGGHGPWMVGGNVMVDTSTEQFCGQICDIRIENTVRSQAYFAALYRRAMWGELP